MQHTATHCNSLQLTATHCNPLQHTTTPCNTHMNLLNTLQHTTTHYNTLQHTHESIDDNCCPTCPSNYDTKSTQKNDKQIFVEAISYEFQKKKNLYLQLMVDPFSRTILYGAAKVVGSLKKDVSSAKEPYERDYILQKRLISLSSLLILATPLSVFRDPH